MSNYTTMSRKKREEPEGYYCLGFDLVRNLLDQCSNISTVMRLIRVDFSHLKSLLASDSSCTDGKETVPSDAFNDRSDEAQRNVIKSNLKLFLTKKELKQ